MPGRYRASRSILRPGSGETGTADWSAALDRLTDAGAKVIVVTPLAPKDPTKAPWVSAIATADRDAAASRPDVITADGDQVLAGRPNTFSSSDGRAGRLRKNDGEHLCPLAAQKLAVDVCHAAAEWFTVNTDQAWFAGTWWLDSRYASPDEGCIG